MLLRLGIGILGCAAVVGAFSLAACSSDDTPTNNTTTTPDAGNGGTDSGGNTQTDSGGSTDTDSGNTATGQPITGLTQGDWLWVDFPDSECADGSATGIGVNLGTTKDLVIYLEGGGACWNAAYCGAAPQAAYLHGFGKTDFENVTNDTGPNQQSSQPGSAKQPGGLLDRTTQNNPYKDASFVYIPYCTGDVHSGDIVKTYDGLATPIHHSGRKNLDAFLKRIVPTFSDQTRVTLTGSSAGGFGAAINYERFKKAFGTVRMDLIDDSGPPFPNADIASYADWSAAWDLTTAFPAGCTNCATDVTQLFPYLSKTYPDAKFALLQYDQDHTIRQFFGTASADVFHTQLDSVISTQFDPTTNAKVFEVDANAHEMLFEINTVSSNDATPETLAAWLTEMNGDAATWATRKVPPVQH